MKHNNNRNIILATNVSSCLNHSSFAFQKWLDNVQANNRKFLNPLKLLNNIFTLERQNVSTLYKQWEQISKKQCDQ